MRFLAAALLAVALASASPAAADWTVIPHGDVAGGDELVLPLGGISNLRNIQGGVVTGNPADLNLDLAAGDANHRGYVVFDWDLGAGVLIFDGSATHAGLVASFLPGRIDFYRPVYFHSAVNLYVPEKRCKRDRRHRLHCRVFYQQVVAR